jgi:hypothetical protein
MTRVPLPGAACQRVVGDQPRCWPSRPHRPAETDVAIALDSVLLPRQDLRRYLSKQTLRADNGANKTPSGVSGGHRFKHAVPVPPTPKYPLDADEVSPKNLSVGSAWLFFLPHS